MLELEIREGITEKTKGMISKDCIDDIVEVIEGGVFFDSNVLLHHLADTKKEATELIGKVENREIKGFINDVVVSEVVYGYIRAV